MPPATTPDYGNDEEKELNFEQKRANFFGSFALKHLSVFRLHKEFGLLPQKEGWGNVCKHCLVEGVAADTLADCLHLDIESKKRLVNASLLHDFFKRKEVESAKTTSNAPAEFDRAANKSSEILKQKNIDKKTIEIAESAGHMGLPRMLNLLDRLDNLTPHEELQLIFHYLDDITLNDDLVKMNQRVDMLENNPRYRQLNLEGKELYDGKTTFQIQREVGNRIEKWLAERLGMKEQDKLPNLIKDKVMEKIMEQE